MMDGDTPQPGDSVHDLLVGHGFVEHVNSEGSIIVRFGQRTMQYTAAGHYGSIRRLYWEDPVVVIPRRREGIVPVLRKLAATIREDRAKRTDGSP